MAALILRPAGLLLLLFVFFPVFIKYQPEPMEAAPSLTPSPHTPPPAVSSVPPTSVPPTPSPMVPTAAPKPPAKKFISQFDKQRADGLQQWREFLSKDHLEGFDKANLVKSVCGTIEESEEKQMCHKRGRRIGETLIKYYGSKPLTIKASIREQVSKEHSWLFLLSRITISDGRVVGYVRGINAKLPFVTLEDLKIAYLVSVLRKLERIGLLKHTGTLNILASSSDVCEKTRNLSYPVAYVASSASCPHIVPMNGVHLQQWTGFTPKKPTKPFAELKNKVYFRASPYNDHRWMVFLTSATGALPWLDAQAFQRQTKRPTTKDCTKLVNKLAMLNQSFLNGSIPLQQPLYMSATKGRRRVNTKLCLAAQMRGKRVPFDQVLEHKYHLIVDGHAACFRLLGILEGPGVPMLVQQTGTHMSYTQDMIPYVHYIPIKTNLSTMLTDLKDKYEWAEANPEVTKSIAEESTRYAKMHAGSNATTNEWALYIAFLASMHAPEKYTPTADTILPKPCGAPDFFSNAHYPFNNSFKPYHKEKLLEITCNEP